MKISTEIGSISKLTGMEKAVELCGKAGFDAWDFSLFDLCRVSWKTLLPLDIKTELNNGDCLAVARKLRQIGLDNGMVCNQAHAPFPTYSPAVRDSLKRAIECTAEAGGKICVVHPENKKSAEENAEMYAQLLPFAKSCGVKIATENMWSWDEEKDESTFAACATGEDFKKHIDLLDDDFFVACLDIGHAEMRGSGDGAVNMIKALGHRLQALHIHDNDRWRDRHQIPFSMDIDFAAVVKALKEIGYSGEFTLEANCFMDAYTEETAFEGVKALQKAARKLADMFEQA